MKIEEFWNRAFISALARLPVAKARLEADNATKACVEQWQDRRQKWAPQYLTRWQDQEIAGVPLLLEDMELSDDGEIVRKTVPASKNLKKRKLSQRQRQS